MHRINILVLIGVTNYRQKWFRKTIRNNYVVPTLAMPRQTRLAQRSTDSLARR